METLDVSGVVDSALTDVLIKDIKAIEDSAGKDLPEGFPRLIALISQVIVKNSDLEKRVAELERQADSERSYRQEQSEH